MARHANRAEHADLTRALEDAEHECVNHAEQAHHAREREQHVEKVEQRVAFGLALGDEAATRLELGLREREVLAPVAEGLTDRGIVERRVVSQKTVATHVRHILAKLDLPTSALDNRRMRAVITFLSATSP